MNATQDGRPRSRPDVRPIGSKGAKLRVEWSPTFASSNRIGEWLSQRVGRYCTRPLEFLVDMQPLPA